MKKRSIRVNGHATSLLLEAEFWDALEAIARARNIALTALIADIDGDRTAATSLASALRVYALTNRPVVRT